MNQVAPSLARPATQPPLTGIAARRVRPAPAQAQTAPSAPGHDLFDDLKLFATGWIGGLIFFGILFS